MIVMALMAMTPAAKAQTPFNSSAASPCPEVLIEQKYDHVNNPRYQAAGWDTAVTCANRTLELVAEPYIPVQYFNGTYLVEQVPYNPPDPTFHMGTNLGIGSDDVWAGSPTNIPYPFYFFGIRKNHFTVGGNGIVTFASGASGDCAWSYSAPLPWPDGTSGAPSGGATMRDAIYGVYQDTHPTSTSTPPPQGIYYGVQDAYPCRKIICSWNEIPQFNNQTNNRQTYQIVCYEGSNIIEVHIKRRAPNMSWNGGNGLLGIQNATGTPQVPSSNVSDPNYFVVSGSPAYFAPSGWNLATTLTANNIAYRFTPQGTQQYYYKWYRIFDDGQDSVDLAPFATTDTNGHFIPMGSDTTHPTLTQAVVSPRCASRYVMELRFENADGDMYTLRDTISIGYNQYTTLHAPDTIEIHDTTLIELPATGDIPANHEIHDTTFVTLYDTLAATSTWCDTILVQCQCIIHDTLYVSTEKIDESAVFEGTIRFINGQLVVENAGQNTVALYDAAGRQLAVRRNEGAPILFDVPASGTYLVKVGSAPARRIVVVK